MLGYATIGVSDRERSNAFYDEIFGMLGGKRLFNNERLIFWGSDASGMSNVIGVGTPHNDQAATAGNGTMLALEAKDQAQVDAVYAKAIELGAADEGAPGIRVGTFYGGYFRDFDGNKFVVFVM